MPETADSAGPHALAPAPVASHSSRARKPAPRKREKSKGKHRASEPSPSGNTTSAAAPEGPAAAACPPVLWSSRAGPDSKRVAHTIKPARRRDPSTRPDSVASSSEQQAPEDFTLPVEDHPVRTRRSIGARMPTVQAAGALPEPLTIRKPGRSRSSSAGQTMVVVESGENTVVSSSSRDTAGNRSQKALGKRRARDVEDIVGEGEPGTARANKRQLETSTVPDVAFTASSPAASSPEREATSSGFMSSEKFRRLVAAAGEELRRL